MPSRAARCRGEHANHWCCECPKRRIRYPPPPSVSRSYDSRSESCRESPRFAVEPSRSNTFALPLLTSASTAAPSFPCAIRVGHPAPPGPPSCPGARRRRLQGGDQRHETDERPTDRHRGSPHSGWPLPRVTLDAEGWPRIEGRYGQIEHHDGRSWPSTRQAVRNLAPLVALGARRHQIGDEEYRLLFEPALLGDVARVIRARRRAGGKGQSADVMACDNR